jgi:hypothetical protein
MAALELLSWFVFGAVLSLTLPGPRGTKLAAGIIGAMIGGLIGRGLAWQAMIGSYSVSALLIAGISAVVAIEIGLVLSRKV